MAESEGVTRPRGRSVPTAAGIMLWVIPLAPVCAVSRTTTAEAEHRRRPGPPA